MCLSMLIGVAKDNGGDAIGYIFVGFAITGFLTIITLLVGLFLEGRKIFEGGSKALLGLILTGFSLGQILLIRVLSLW